MRKAAILAALLVLQSFTPVRAQTEASRLHAVFVANTDDRNIGFNCGRDVTAFQSHLQTAFGAGSNRLVIHNLTGNRWSGSRVMSYLAKLRINPNDSVVFFHSGHGGIRKRNQPADSHEIILNRGSRIKRGDLRRLLLRHRPRSVIILTDCCSSYMSIAAFDSAPAARPNTTTIRNLFLRTRGVVDITAAEDGTNAIASHVGVNRTGAESAFTVAFLSLLDSSRSYRNWEEFYSSLRRKTGEVSGSKHRARAFFLPSTSRPNPSTPMRLAGSSWLGRESLRGFGGLRFDFASNGRVYMVDAKQRVAGRYSVNGNQVRLSFFRGRCVYTGAVSGSRMSGSAVTSKGVRYTWSVDRSARPSGGVTVVSNNSPAPVRLTGGSWNGSETLSGYGRLAFSFGADGAAVMTDARGRTRGSWRREGNSITIRFGNCIYVGSLNGRVLAGGAVSGNSGRRWNFRVSR